MEPMDLDRDDLYYRSKSCPSPPASPPLSPCNVNENLSDMEIDTNSPPVIQHGQRCKSVAGVSAASLLERVNSSLDTVLSFKSIGATSKKSNNKTMESSVNVVSRPFTKTSLAVSSPGKQKRKTGYGLCNDDDDEAIFSHYPKSNSERQNMISSVRNRMSKENTDSKFLIRTSDPECYNRNSQSKELQKNVNKGVLLKFFYFCFFLFLVFMIFQLYNTIISKSCNNNGIFQTKILAIDLKSHLFGQHIASRIIKEELNQYFKQYSPDNSHVLADSEKMSDSNTVIKRKHVQCRPLILSLHGWTGVGKNFASRIISQSFTSINIHQLIIPLVFPHIGNQELYEDQIQNWTLSISRHCSVNLFVIDEMDKAFPAITRGLFTVINSLSVSSCSSSISTPTIFILISNTHASAINKVFVDEYTSLSPTQSRLDIEHKSFHSIFSESQKEWYSQLASAGMINAFVPFLPLEKSHVIDCIKQDLISKQLSTEGEIIAKVLEELSFSVLGDLELSTTGCKRVADKVNFVIYNMD